MIAWVLLHLLPQPNSALVRTLTSTLVGQEDWPHVLVYAEAEKTEVAGTSYRGCPRANLRDYWSSCMIGLTYIVPEVIHPSSSPDSVCLSLCTCMSPLSKVFWQVNLTTIWYLRMRWCPALRKLHQLLSPLLEEKYLFRKRGCPSKLPVYL